MRWGHHSYKIDKSEWHEWFAWHPVKVEEGFWVWLEPIERKLKSQGLLFPSVLSYYRVTKGARQ